MSRHCIDTSTTLTAELLDNLPDERLIEVASGAFDSTLSTDTVQREPYVMSPQLIEAVNVSIGLGRPLLLQGEPGCGKTRLAYAIAFALALPIEEVYVKSTSH